MKRPVRADAAGRAYLDLQNRARRERRGTQELLTMYVVERWLARLSRSEYAEDFILKGGTLLASFGHRRPTVDADALARNMSSDHALVASRVAEIAALSDPDDGMEFLIETIRTQTIRDDALYSGIRLVMDARLATAQLKLRLDINFGDPVTPGPHFVDLPPLRPNASPIRVLGYPMETVLAEKLATAIDLGPANTRVRDFTDVYVITGTHGFKASDIRAALEATATFRQVELEPLSAAVVDLAQLRAVNYLAYRNSLGETVPALPETFQEVVEVVASFVDPVLNGLDGDPVWNPTRRMWLSSAGAEAAPRPRSSSPGAQAFQ